MALDLETVLVLSACAFGAGALNSVAGGGTLLTFPALTAVVSPAVANATSTVALLPGFVAGAFGYRQELGPAQAFAWRMAAPSFLGGLLGAWLVGQSPELFANLVPWLILLAAALFTLQPIIGRFLRRKSTDTHPPGLTLTVALIAAQFVIAVYGGYFGAGIGILMLTALGFLGIGNLHRMNAVKTVLSVLINIAAAIVFAWNGALIRWDYCAVMAVASIAGGYFGARGARRLPTSVVRGMVIVIGYGLAAFYFARR
jgi:hypothetical protein